MNYEKVTSLPFVDQFVDFLRDWRAEKEREHLIPTVDLLIEELEEIQGEVDMSGATESFYER